jgi:hypothetical protein
LLVTYHWVPYATHEAHWLAPSHTAYCTGCEVIKSQPVTVKLQWNSICSFINTCIKCSPCNNCHAPFPHRKTSYNVYGLQVTSYDWDNKKTGRWYAVENVTKIGARLKDLTSTAHQCVCVINIQCNTTVVFISIYDNCSSKTPWQRSQNKNWILLSHTSRACTLKKWTPFIWFSAEAWFHLSP